MKGVANVAAGRPRNFCKNEALDKALGVFWRQGFEGASISDLTDAMGINPPSLYAAFGNKEQLFRQALDRYSEVSAARRAEALGAASAREAIETYLRGVVLHLTDRSSPAGCLYVQGIAGAGEHAACIREMLNAKRLESERDICARLEQGKEDGELSDDADPAVLARYVATVTQGLSVQAAGGASRKDLERVADLALRVWPSA